METNRQTDKKSIYIDYVRVKLERKKRRNVIYIFSEADIFGIEGDCTSRCIWYGTDEIIYKFSPEIYTIDYPLNNEMEMVTMNVELIRLGNFRAQLFSRGLPFKEGHTHFTMVPFKHLID